MHTLLVATVSTRPIHCTLGRRRWLGRRARRGGRGAPTVSYPRVSFKDTTTYFIYAICTSPLLAPAIKYRIHTRQKRVINGGFNLHVSPRRSVPRSADHRDTSAHGQTLKKVVSLLAAACRRGNCEIWGHLFNRVFSSQRFLSL